MKWGDQIMLGKYLSIPLILGFTFAVLTPLKLWAEANPDGILDLSRYNLKAGMPLTTVCSILQGKGYTPVMNTNAPLRPDKAIPQLECSRGRASLCTIRFHKASDVIAIVVIAQKLSSKKKNTRWVVNSDYSGFTDGLSRYNLSHGMTYVHAKAVLRAAGWNPILSQSEPHQEKNFPEISCGAGLDAVCEAGFQKGDKTLVLSLYNLVKSLQYGWYVNGIGD